MSDFFCEINDRDKAGKKYHIILSKSVQKKKKKNSESSCSWTTALQIVLLLDVLLFFLAACVFHCSMQKAKARGAQTFSEAMQ